jgi:hypothetical protein
MSSKNWHRLNVFSYVRRYFRNRNSFGKLQLFAQYRHSGILHSLANENGDRVENLIAQKIEREHIPCSK